MVIKVTEQRVWCGAGCSSFSFSCEPFGYRHSYVNTVQSTCQCVCACVCLFAMCIRMWECTQKPFEVPHSLYTPLPHVSSLFEGHVAMIIKAALSRLQTYGRNMDVIWHQTFHRHPALHCHPSMCCCFTGPVILNYLCGSWTCHLVACLATLHFFSFYPHSSWRWSSLASSQALAALR